MARKRRWRGEGSIHQRGDGLWVATASLGYHGDGSRKRITTYGATKREAQEKLTKKMGEAAAGLDGEASTVSLGQWLDRWLAVVKPTVEPNTYRPHERQVRLHLKPHLGTVKLGKIRRAHLQALYSALSEADVSGSLQRKVATTLTTALNEAVDHQMLVANPLASRRSKRGRKPKAARSEIRPLDPDQVAVFLKAAKDDRLFAFYRTALDSGARPGELFALLWSDVDFERGCISITKSLEEINGHHRVKETKTEQSRRIDLSADTVAALAGHRKAAFAAGHIQGPVFCNTIGGYIRLSDLHRHSFKPILRAAKLANIRLYDLRHTCATLLLLADVPAKVVSERLGHSTITLTLNTYSHVLPTMQRRAADAIGRLLGAKPENAERKAE
jgi:integrase